MLSSFALGLGLLGAANAAELVAKVSGATDDVTGWVTLYENGTLWYDVEGLSEGVHAIHIHEYGDLRSGTGSSAGGHWNPSNSSIHSCLEGQGHAGDLGNITADATGHAMGSISTWVLDSFDDAAGRGIIIHADPDYCTPNDNGNAGARVAWGVLGQVAGSDLGFVSYPDYVTSLVGTEGNNITGTVYFWYNATANMYRVDLMAQSTSFSEGDVHAFHIHNYGDLRSTDGTSAGGHYNPSGVDHGEHVGDLGNAIVNADGILRGQGWVNTSSMPVLAGRAIVVHALPDQGPLEQPSGGAGSRVAWGVVAVANPSETTTFPAVVATDEDPVLVAKVFGTVSGTVSLYRISSLWTMISWDLDGVTGGNTHALHLHTYGDITATDGSNAGGHYNPANVAHGCYPNSRHSGDLLLLSTNSGYLIRDLVDLDMVAGRSIIIHESYNCTTGAAGARIGQGVLGLTATSDVALPGSSEAMDGILVASLSGTDGNEAISGTAIFGHSCDMTQITVSISGLEPNSEHAFHIHAYGDITASDGTSAGGHFNPDDVDHGLPTDAIHHMGDLGSLTADAAGDISYSWSQDYVDFDMIVGRAVVLHNSTDLGSASQPSGGAGPRLALGTIGLSGADLSTICGSASAPSPSFAVALALIVGFINYRM